MRMRGGFCCSRCCSRGLGAVTPHRVGGTRFILIPEFVEKARLRRICRAVGTGGVSRLGARRADGTNGTEMLAVFSRGANRIARRRLGSFGGGTRSCHRRCSCGRLCARRRAPRRVGTGGGTNVRVVGGVLSGVSDGDPLRSCGRSFFGVCITGVGSDFGGLISRLGVPLSGSNGVRFSTTRGVAKMSVRMFFSGLGSRYVELNLSDGVVSFIALGTDVPVTIGNYPGPMVPACLDGMIGGLRDVSRTVFGDTVAQRRLPNFRTTRVAGINFGTAGSRIDCSGRLGCRPGNRHCVRVVLPGDGFNFTGGTSNACGSISRIESGSNGLVKNLLGRLRSTNLSALVNCHVPARNGRSIYMVGMINFLSSTRNSAVIIPSS